MIAAPSLVLVLAIVVAVVQASEGGAQYRRRVPHRPTTTARAPTTTTSPGVSPLTGLAPSHPTTLSQPAVVVKIDNAPEARPQSGLDQADVVYEEVVEGGVTRYFTVFQSQSPDLVGPVRSVRQTDADVVAPIGGLFAYSGGIPAFISDVTATGVVDVGVNADPGAYHRDPTRAAPHNLYTSVPTLRQRTPAGAHPPPPLFSFVATGAGFQAAGATPISQLRVPMSAQTVATWSWDTASGMWQRSTNGVPQTTSGGAPLAFTNVVIELVAYHDTGFTDPAHNPVPDADVVGTGSAVVLSGGRMASAYWAKATSGAVTSYTDTSGAPISLVPGRTWVMLAPVGTVVSTG